MTSYTNQRSEPEEAAVRGTEWRARLNGLVPEGIDRRKVAILGCGSVGSFIAAEFARAGIRDFVLVDPDHIEWANLTRTIYGHADVGRKKVSALADHLKGIFEDIKVVQHPASVQLLCGSSEDHFRDVDFVVSAVDDPAATGFANRFFTGKNIPTMFVSLYQGARGGEIIINIPKKTPCFHCSTGGIRQISEGAGLANVTRARRDYGTNRLVAEVALGSDIHFVCCAAVKIGLSVMCSADSATELGSFVWRQIDEGCNYIMFGMAPDYHIFPMSHAQAMGQHAFQSLWANTTREPECHVCGDV